MWAAFGANMLNKLGENSSNLWGTGRALKEKEAEDKREQFIFEESNGIVARTEAAKAAGLHPLAALGYQGHSSPTTLISGTSSGDYGYRSPERPAQVERDPNLDRLNAANARRAEAEADMAELNAHNAYRATATQPGNPPAGSALPTDPANQVGSQRGGIRPGVVIKPDEVTAGINGFTAGTHPSATAVRIPGGKYGRYFNLPSEKFSQMGEDMELLKYWLTLQANRDSLSKFIVDDIPWAFKGSLQDLRKRFGLPPARAFNKRRSGGATGSW